jgi:L-threonylcarbamoyladenylate synthase
MRIFHEHSYKIYSLKRAYCAPGLRVFIIRDFITNIGYISKMSIREFQSSNFWHIAVYLFTKEKSMIRPFFWPDNKARVGVSAGQGVLGNQGVLGSQGVADGQGRDKKDRQDKVQGSSGVIAQLVTLFSQNNVILGDSDTVLGLYAPLTQEGFLALNRLKKRAEKPYLVLVANKERALSLVANPMAPELLALMDACWPGPVTLICKARLNNNSGLEIPDTGYAVSGWGTIGLRVPDHAGLQELLPHFEGLFSTSANITGNPVPHSLGQVDPEIAHAVAGVVLNRDTKSTGGVASTILDCTALTGVASAGTDSREMGEVGSVRDRGQNGAQNSKPEIKLIREGAYPVSLIEERAHVIITR